MPLTNESTIEERREEMRRHLRPTQQVPEIDAWTGDLATTHTLIVALVMRHATSEITPEVIMQTFPRGDLSPQDAIDCAGLGIPAAALAKFIRNGGRNPWPLPPPWVPDKPEHDAMDVFSYHTGKGLFPYEFTDAARDDITWAVNRAGSPQGDDALRMYKGNRRGRALLRQWEAATGGKIPGGIEPG